MMDGVAVIRKLGAAFPGSFINTNYEFIAHKKANAYFRLDDCECEFDVKCKVLEWLSRSAYKAQPFGSASANTKYHAFMLNGINTFLGTEFTKDDIALIYQHLGNRVNHDLTERFIAGGYDLNLLEG